MTQTFDCPTCGAPLDIDIDADPVIRCPYCKGSVVVPSELRDQKVQSTTQGSIGKKTGVESLSVQAELLAEVTRLAQSGKKIEAIKLFRMLTGVSLSDAKRTVEAIQAGQSISLSDLQEPPPILDKTAMLYRIRQLIDEGKRTEAVRLYRETFDVSLAEAAAAVEKIRAGHFEEVQSQVLQVGYVRLVQPPVQVVNPLKPVYKAATIGGLSVGCFTIGLVSFILLVTIVPIIAVLAQRGGPLFNTWARINPFSYARLEQSFGGEGTGAGLFEDARQIAVDPQTGNIFVADYLSSRLQVFDPQGIFLTQWTVGSGKSAVQDLDIDRQGNAYLIYGGEIHVLDVNTGTELATISLYREAGNYFSNLALIEDGGLLAVSSGEDLVRFNNDRTIQATFPDAISAVSGDSELDSRIAVDGLGNLYILGIFNNSVFIFSPEGKLISRFGSSGDAEGQFSAPYAIAVDNQSRVYVSDSKGVQVFEQDGRYLDKFQPNGFVFGIDINDKNEIFTISNDQTVSKFVLKAP